MRRTVPQDPSTQRELAELREARHTSHDVIAALNEKVSLLEASGSRSHLEQAFRAQGELVSALRARLEERMGQELRQVRAVYSQEIYIADIRVPSISKSISTFMFKFFY